MTFHVRITKLARRDTERNVPRVRRAAERRLHPLDLPEEWLD